MGVADGKPTYADVRNRVHMLIPFAEALEDSLPLRDANAQIATLEAEIQSFKASLDSEREQRNSEAKNLFAELTTANAEIERLRKEQNHRQHEQQHAEEPNIDRESAVQSDSPETKALSSVETRLMFYFDQNGYVEDMQAAEFLMRDPKGGLTLLPFERAFCVVCGLAADGLLFSRGGNNTLTLTEKGKSWLAKNRTSDQPAKIQRKHNDRTKTEEDVMDALANLGNMSCDDFGAFSDVEEISADRAEVALADLEKDGFVKVAVPARLREGPEMLREGRDVPPKYILSVEGIRYMLERGFLH
jgi:hypothetical protein